MACNAMHGNFEHTGNLKAFENCATELIMAFCPGYHIYRRLLNPYNICRHARKGLRK